MPRAYCSYYGESACPYHRILLPTRFCTPEFEEYGWQVDIGEGLPKGYDVYLFHGLPNELALVEITKIKQRGAKFVWSVDDDWTSIPDWNPAKPSDTGLAMYGAAKQLSDYIVVSTRHLASTFKDVGEKVLYAPNLLDLTQFTEIPYVWNAEEGRRHFSFKVELPVRVVWVGGPTHSEDIAVVVEAMHKLHEKYDASKMVSIFYGMMPPSSLLKKYLYRGMFHQPMVPFSAYQKTLNSVRPSVYLAPLASIEFNKSKSNLRIMEGWALNSAPVASDWGEYQCIRNGVDGRVATNVDEWFSALSRLVTDHEYRLKLAIEGRTRVEQEYSWNNPANRSEWYRVFSTIFETPNPGAR